MTGVVSVTMPSGSITVSKDEHVKDAVARLDDNGPGVVFVIDGNQHVLGHLTVETIGHHLRGGGDPSDPVGDVMTAGAAENMGPPGGTIPVASPCLSGNELDYLTQCIEDNSISSIGPFVERFERGFADYLGAEHALATSSGTTALHLSLAALGVGPGDEVIIPDLTFAASANAVIHAGATPVLVDVTPDSWTMDVAAARDAVSPKTRAIMPVHLYGQPAPMAELQALARELGLLLIEDAAEALGSTYDGRPVGGFGDAAIFSFFGNKLITTGEGGMAVFRSAEAAERAKILRDHGMRPDKRYWHDVVGFNYRMTNLQAAVGCAQLEQIDRFIERKLEIGASYRRALADCPGLTFPAVRENARNTYWLFSLVVDAERVNTSRDDLMARLHKAGIETRPVFHPLHQMPPYESFGGGRSFEASTHISKSGISLPSSITLSDEDIEYVAGAIRGILEIRALAREYGL